MLEYLPCSSRNDSHQSFIKDILTIHRESLTTSSLAISKYSAIISLHDIFYSLFANYSEYFFLGSWRIETMIKGEWHIAMSTVIIINFHSLLIILEYDSLSFIATVIGIYHFFFKLIKWSKSWYNLDLLFLIS